MSDGDLTAASRLLRCLNDGRPDLGALWEFCAHHEWADRAATVAGIAAWLRGPDGLRVLDASCGSGFPAIDLRALGYDVTCSDGSEAMLAHFRRNAEARGVLPTATRARWEELSEVHGTGAFDVVMCRGCSLLYAGTWDEDGEPDREILTSAVKQFVACLRPGGRLYVDIAHRADLESLAAQWSPVRELTIGDHHIELREVVSNRPDDRTRVWRSWLTVDGVTHEFARRSHHLGHEELVELLTDAGLVDVHPEPIPGEHYAVFVGTRA